MKMTFKKTLLYLTAGAALLGCQSLEMDLPHETRPGVDSFIPSGNPITFSLEETKSNVTMTESFAVTAVWTGGTLMDEQTVSWNGTDWEYAPVKYWPQGCEEMTFNAYAPAGISSLDTSSAPDYVFTLPVDASANFSVAPETVATDNSASVTLTFQRTLARFALVGNLSEEPSATKGVRVTGVRISNQPDGGTWSAASSSWSEISDNLITVTRAMDVEVPEDGTPCGMFYLMPGTQAEGTTLEIDWEIYRLADDAVTYQNTVSADLSGRALVGSTSFGVNLGINARADIIAFADPAVKAICVTNWDQDGDGEIDYYEASRVTSVGELFRGNTDITSFDEFKYFTGVTSLGNNAFRECTNLTSIDCSNVRSMGNSCFLNSTSLVTCTTSEALQSINMQAFSGCSSLEEFNLQNCTTIPYQGFMDCTALRHLYAPSATTAGESCCSRCTSLTEIDLPNVTTSGRNSFYNCSSVRTADLPSLTSAGERFLTGATSLVSLNVPELVSCSTDAFSYCSSLTSVSLPKCTTIGGCGFEYCTLLETINAPLLETIGERGVRVCPALKSVITGSGTLTTIRARCFEDDAALESIDLSEVTTIGNTAFRNTTSLTETANFPVLTTLGHNVFLGSALSGTLTAPNLQSTGVGAFSGSAITKIDNLGSITAVTGGSATDKGVFENCSLLTEAVLPSTCTTVGRSGFKNCTALETINLDKIEVFGITSFAYTSSLTETASLPAAVTINAAAFYESAISGALNAPNLTGTLGNRAFYRAAISSISNLGSITTLEETGAGNGHRGVFQECASLVSAVLPSSLTDIGKNAFYHCTSLQTINLNYATRFGPTCFSDCPALDIEADLPEAVTIEQGAFMLSGIKGILSAPKLESFGTGDAGQFAETRITKISDLGSLVSIPNRGTAYSGVRGSFSQCYYLTEVTLPTTCKTIGNYAFIGDNLLSSISMPEVETIGSYVFVKNEGGDGGLESLTSLTAPKVKTIGDYSFRYTYIENPSFPSLESISRNAFQGSAHLKTFYAPNLTAVSANVFNSCSALTSITARIETVGEYAFTNCQSLASLDVSHITSIGSSAFRGTSALAIDLNMPNLQTLSGPNTFMDSGITGITSLGHITSLPTGAGGTNGNVGVFYRCTHLTSVTLPDDVSTVPAYTFCNCTSLTTVTGLNHITAFGSYCFSKAPISAPTSVVSNATSIGSNAFNGSALYGDLALPNLTGTGLGTAAFVSNTGITSISDLGSVSIFYGGDGTNGALGPFAVCPNITTVILPATTTSIGQNFISGQSGSGSLSVLICNATTPPTLDSNAIKGTVSGFTIYVPDASVNTYKAASIWSNYAGQIQGISSYTP